MKTLTIGSRGPQVELLQLALSRAGYYTGAPDGIFGPQTRNAVLAFQRAFGLNADTVVGSMTWNRLIPFIMGYTTVTVRRGDSFYSLASRYYTTIRAIETANPDIDPLNLTVGTQIIVPFGYSVVPTNISFTSTVMELSVRGLRARYPFLETGSAGSSVLGRPLYTLEIGSGENQVFYNGSHHANEWITTPLLMKYLEDYCAAYVSGDSIGGRSAQQLYSLTTLYMIPMVNPDGADLVTGEIEPGSESYYRALSINDPPVPFPSGWKANINGVDLNLQYPAGWERARAIKFAQGYTRPGPRDYVGTAPLTQPESRAVYNYTLSHDFSITLSYHTQGRVIYWKYDDFQPQNSYEIAVEMGRISGYTPELTPAASSWAGYKDWFIQQYNRPGYTIEAGEGTSPLPLSQFDRIYSDNVGILTYAQIATI